MKTRLIIILTLLINLAQAQDFEGTVLLSMKMEITDPDLKKMMGENAKPMVFSLTMKTKNGNSVGRVEGGVVRQMGFLHRKDKNESYTINHVNKTYVVTSAPENHNPERKVTINKTDETMKILNYTCTKSIVTAVEAGKTSTSIFWTTDELKDLDFKNIFSQNMNNGKQTLIYEDLQGVPLKIEIPTPQGMMTLEVTEIKKEALPDSDFTIPSGYTKAVVPGQ